ncbi:type II secretion system secretin GspD [Peristeroidobacter agariperforans]|uniref:type II secretion system secretin GspD n=1 Tax=Peristeroidobacter agariperforans TaxID=268404 RepID=UPI001300B1A5|nr:type II secretion system secretin GspD [Peristeroidobacter agariperforans]
MTISSTTPAAGKPASVLSGKRSGLLALTMTCLLTCVSATAQQQQQQPSQQATITPAFRDAELTEIIDAVATITGKTFIVDPRVRAQVTIRSSTPMTPDAFYQTFLSILQVHGFIAVPSGDNIKILPDANARQIPGNDLPSSVNPNSDEVVTQVISVRNINAAQLVPVLRPLIPQNGHLVAYPASNMLIVSDRANNIARIMRIVQRLDQGGDEEIEIVRLENASAADIVRVVNTLSQGAQQQGEAPGMAAKLVADDRTNSVLISGEKGQRLRLKGLVMHLDTPLESGGDTQVRYLNYADAEQIAGKLKEQVTGITQAAPGAPGAPGGAAGPAAAQDRNTTIWADKQTNAIVVTAAPKMMRQIMGVVDKLDIRRAQVHLEAILVEITQSRAAELGVNWAVFSEEQGSTIPIGTFNQDVGGTSLGSLASAIINPDVLESGSVGLPTGLTLGAGMIEDGGLNFAVLLRALRNDGSSNILQTPSITTLDNEEAEIKVAQEVPFITGQYTNTGTTNQGSVNPFQTIQREEVGNILKITPQINEGTAVQLKIEQENSNLTQGVAGAVDLITNKRTISTTVLVEDGGMIVLGGLITDTVNEGEARVPILGNIPIIGELFKTRNGSKEKRNLMVFIRPTILRDGVAAAITTSAKYNVLRDQQLQRRKGGKVTLLPGERQPLLPPIEDLAKYADPTAGAAAPAPGTNPEEQPPPAQTEPLPEQSPPPKP